MAHEGLNEYDAAEQAYQNSLRISVQFDQHTQEEATLAELGYLYAKQRRYDDAARFYADAVEIAVSIKDRMAEGADRSSLAGIFIKLERYDEARIELGHAMKCQKRFGHAAQPWSALRSLSELERAVGNEAAAQDARRRARDAYSAFRRAGGEIQTVAGGICALARSSREEAKKLLELPESSSIEPSTRLLITLIQSVLTGCRDPSLADDPRLDFDEAAELLLLIESLL
jgi:tetratricopeptide (TPR) repeat protein